MGNALLKFAAKEIEDLTEMIDDIMTALGSSMTVKAHAYQSCEAELEEPDDEDLQ